MKACACAASALCTCSVHVHAQRACSALVRANLLAGPRRRGERARADAVLERHEREVDGLGLVHALLVVALRVGRTLRAGEVDDHQHAWARAPMAWCVACAWRGVWRGAWRVRGMCVAWRVHDWRGSRAIGTPGRGASGSSMAKPGWPTLRMPTPCLLVEALEVLALRAPWGRLRGASRGG